MKIKTARGATPLSAEDLEGLIPSLTTQGELDEFEGANILEGTRWALKSRVLKRDLLSVTGLCILHEKMFDKTWEWAGKFRPRMLNIGSEPKQIQSDLGILLGDVKYWAQHQTFSPEEIAVRFSHRLVKVHPFRNGNGRFSRIAGDLLSLQLGGERFRWGDGFSSAQRRSEYLEALRIADQSDDVTRLLAFAKG